MPRTTLPPRLIFHPPPTEAPVQPPEFRQFQFVDHALLDDPPPPGQATATGILAAEMAGRTYNDDTLRRAVDEEGFRPHGYMYSRCSCCSKWSYTTNLVTAYAGLQQVCPVCAPTYVHCDGCSSLILASDQRLHIHGAEILENAHLNTTQAYNANIMDITEGGFRHTDRDRTPRYGGDLRYLGVELEIERGLVYPPDVILKSYRSMAQGFVIVKHDGSLQAAPGHANRGSNGFELVTLPATLGYHLREAGWDTLFEVVGPYAQERARTAGLHVHVSHASMTRGTVGKVVAFINSPANLPFLTTIADRDFTAPNPVTGKVYAPIFDPLTRVRDLIDKRKHQSQCLMAPRNRILRRHYLSTDRKVRMDVFNNPIIQSVSGSDSVMTCTCPEGRYEYADHYAALNVRTNLPTIEFRIFQASMNPTHFYASLDFCDALLNFCDSTGFRDLGVADFLGWFKANRSHHPHLAKWLVITGYIEARRGKKKSG